MIAWYGDPKLKSAAMDRLREHQRLDQFRQGLYFEEGKGCHLGCLTHASRSSHEATERMFGIEQRIAYWLETVFEGLPPGDAAEWVIESTEAIPVGADMSRCHHHLAVWLLGPDSPSSAGNQHHTVRAAVEGMRRLHMMAARGETVTDAQWQEAISAATAAESAALTAALTAAGRSAEWSAWSPAAAAAWSAESARLAESAAESAALTAEAWSSAARLAESARSAWKQIAFKSMEIFRDAPVRQPTASEECDQCVRESMARLASDAMV